jgi:hypothetical protein
MLASTLLSAGGSALGGIQANNQSKYEAAVARNNERVQVNAARESEEIGRDEARDLFRDVSQTKGNQVAAMAANGIDLGLGSALRVQEDTNMQGREDANALYRNIKNRTQGSLVNAQNYASEAKASRSRGKAAFTAGLISGASTLIGGASQYKGQREKLGKSGWF